MILLQRRLASTVLESILRNRLYPGHLAEDSLRTGCFCPVMMGCVSTKQLSRADIWKFLKNEDSPTTNPELDCSDYASRSSLSSPVHVILDLSIRRQGYQRQDRQDSEGSGESGVAGAGRKKESSANPFRDMRRTRRNVQNLWNWQLLRMTRAIFWMYWKKSQITQ